MSLNQRPQEETVGVAFARTMLVLVMLTFLGWLFSASEHGPCAGNAAAAAQDAGP